MDLAGALKDRVRKPELFLVFWPIVVLPVFLGGARPWLWGGVAGIFGIVFSIYLWTSKVVASAKHVRKPFFILLPILLYPFLQSVPLPLPAISLLSPQRALWLERAGQATGGSYWGASLSYVPVATVFSGLWLVMLALFALVLHGLIRKGALKSDNFFLVVFIIASLEALYGLIQVLVPSIGVLGLYPATGNASGTFVNRNHYAAFLGMLWPLQLAWLMALSHKKAHCLHDGYDNYDDYDESSRKQMTREKQAFFLFLTGLVLLGIIFSQSRGGIFSTLIGTTVFLSLSGRHGRSMRRFVAACWIIAIAYGWIIGFEDIAQRFLRMENDGGQRFQIWEATWKMMWDHRISGTGVGTYAPVVFLYDFFDTDLLQIGEGHNDYLQLPAEWGFFYGLFIILLVWGYWLATAIDLVRRHAGEDRQPAAPAEERLIRAGALAGSAAFLSHIWVEFNWQIAANQLYFVMLLVLMRYRTAPDQDARHR